MKTYTKEQMILSDGEVSIHNEYGTMLASTNPPKGFALIEHLDHKSFIRRVDVEALAEISANALYHPVSEPKQDYKKGFIAGYNANKAEFTREQMKQAIRQAWKTGLSIDRIIDNTRLLEIPESITVDENFNVIEVKWE